MHMSRIPRFAPISLFALAVLLWTAGCKSNPNQNAANSGQTPPADTSQAAAPDASSDPASANLAPVSTAPQSTPGASAPAASSGGQESAPAPTDTAASSAPAANQATDDSDYGEQPVATAPEPPPALPEYQQPAAPGDDYLWTPGYWGYVSTGYYWVPGAWVQAPYQGALWTPGYWGWSHNHYGFYRGYWGPHIGFYGGVNYGFGYVGVGYQGGYWNSGHFYYNRAVNNINVTVIHNVYNRTVIVNNNVHVSFNGGRGGIQVRPRPAELAALREPHAPPMAAQVQKEHAASVDRAQFAAVNHGHPENVVVAKALVADRDVHPVAPPAARNLPNPEPRGATEAHPNAAQPARANEPARPGPARTEPNRPAEKPAPARPEAASHAAPPPQVSKPKPEERAAPTKPKPEAHPAASKPKPEERPAPRTESPAKPEAQKASPEKKASPAKPEPKKEPAEKPKKEDERPQ
jgi:hypothetical protein